MDQGILRATYLNQRIGRGRIVEIYLLPVLPVPVHKIEGGRDLQKIVPVVIVAYGPYLKTYRIAQLDSPVLVAGLVVLAGHDRKDIFPLGFPFPIDIPGTCEKHLA